MELFLVQDNSRLTFFFFVSHTEMSFFFGRSMFDDPFFNDPFFAGTKSLPQINKAERVC